MVSKEGVPSFSVDDAKNDGDWSEVLATREARLRSCASMRQILNTVGEFEAFEHRLEKAIQPLMYDITRRPAGR
jgi:hypothetical protein